MSEAFVWFHNSSDKPTESGHFYEAMLGWQASEGPGGLTMLAGVEGPFAALGEADGVTAGWIPFVRVDDVEAATARAVDLGARLLKGRTQGPAGAFSVVQDPGGAALALWEKA
ncbi:MAG: hypothetical protein H6697_12440 [Myxococcales bacterium]|nr:hypothetical protein [Myxococcales bacterium]